MNTFEIAEMFKASDPNNCVHIINQHGDGGFHTIYIVTCQTCGSAVNVDKMSVHYKWHKGLQNGNT